MALLAGAPAARGAGARRRALPRARRLASALCTGCPLSQLMGQYCDCRDTVLVRTQSRALAGHAGA